MSRRPSRSKPVHFHRRNRTRQLSLQLLEQRDLLYGSQLIDFTEGVNGYEHLGADIFQNNPAANDGAGNLLRTGWARHAPQGQSGYLGLIRGALAFELPGIPAGSTIQDVTLSTTIIDGVGSPGDVELRLVDSAQSLVEGTKTLEITESDGITWTDAGPSAQWSAPGGDFSATAVSIAASVPVTDTMTTPVPMVFESTSNFVAAAQAALDESRPLQLMLVVPSAETGAPDQNFYRLAADDYGNVGLRPHLSVTYQPPVLPQPISYYPLDGNAQDIVGGRNGTLLGDATFSTDVPATLGTGGSLFVDGTLDKLAYDVVGDDAVTGSFTVAMWVNAMERRPDGTLGFFGTRTPDTAGFDLKFRLDSDIRVDVGDGAGFLSISDVGFNYNLDEWHHVAVAVTPGSLSLYVDGDLLLQESFGPGTPVLFDADHDIAIGSIYALAQPNGPPFGEDFHGLIDDVRLYDLALSPQEVAILASSPVETVLFTENFDAPPSDTQLTQGVLPGWDVIYDSLSVSNDTANSAPNSLTGQSGGGLGSMFYPADGITELQFSFLRKENVLLNNYGETADIAIVPDEDISSTYHSLGGTGARLQFHVEARNRVYDPSRVVFDVVGDGEDNESLGKWIIQDDIADNTWYTGLIRIESNHTVTFGYKPVDAPTFTLSTGYPEPADFVPRFVGVTAYKVAPGDATDGLARLDDIVAVHTIGPPDGSIGPISDIDPEANEVAETSPIGTAVGITARATDPDFADTVSYSLDDNAGGRFAIDSVTGIVTVAAGLDYETSTTHAIVIRAASTDGSQRTANFSIGVTDDIDALTFIGTTGDDSFEFSPGPANGEVVVKLNGATLGTFTPSGSILAVGGDGTDTVVLKGNNLSNAFDIYEDRIAFNGIDFYGDQIELRSILALGQNDILTVYGGAATINGGSAADTLIAATADSHQWSLSGANSGNLDGQIIFSSIEQLIGGSGDDVFHLGPGGSLNRTIDGGDGMDTLDYADVSTPVSVHLQSGAATKTGGAVGIEQFVGGQASDTIVGANVANDWSLSDINAGTINGSTSFSAFENVTGGTQIDSFFIAAGGQVTGTLSGGGAADVVDLSSYGGPVTVDLAGQTAAAIGHFTSISRFVGTSDIDTFIGPNTNRTWTFTASGGQVAGVAFDGFENWQGGSAIDTLSGLDVATAWNLTGTNSGSVYAISFTGMENLTGGSDMDTFVLADGAGSTGTLAGGAGADVLDFSQRSEAVTVNLGTASATDVSAFSSIAQFVGGSGVDIFIGANNANVWNLSSATAGAVDSASFSGFETLLGGTAADTFRVSPGVTFAGTIDGGTGTDKLDYAAYATSVVVNLAAGTATGVGGVASVENVTGGDGNDIINGSADKNVLLGGNGDDILLGGAGDDTLSGNNGRDIVVGGSGADNIHGNATEDILIGGATTYADEMTYDVNQAALAAILAEWTRSDLNYAARVAHLSGTTGGGLNGAYRLNPTTVIEDGAIDVLYGDAGLDWFLASNEDIVNNTAGEIITDT